MFQLVQNIDKIIEASSGIEKLRQTVLQFAIKGKLVDQDLNDEPSSELVKKIRAEKAKLIAAGKIKKQKELPLIKEDEELYQLPKGWEWVRLGEIFNIKSSKRIFERDYCLTGIPFYRSREIGELSRLGECENRLFISEKKYSEIRKKFGVPSPGDILLTSVGSIGGCWVVDNRKFYYKDGNVTQIENFAKIDSFFISLYIKSFLFVEQVNDSIAGTAYSALTIIKINNLLFALPPLAEQHRIVEKVNELMKIIDDLEKKKQARNDKRVQLNDSLLDKLLHSKSDIELNASWKRLLYNFNKIYSIPENMESLKQAILQLAVQGKLVEQNSNDEPAIKLLERIKTKEEKLNTAGKIKKQKTLPPISTEEKLFELPESWEWVRLDTLGETLTGTTPPTKDLSNYGNYIPFIGPGDILNYKINYNNNGLSKIGLNKGRLIKKNSIMMVCIGGSIGKAAINQIDVSCNQQINVISPFFSESIKYIFYAMVSRYFQTLIIKKASGSATPIINKQKWASIIIPLPPLAEQQRIVKKVNGLISYAIK